MTQDHSNHSETGPVEADLLVSAINAAKAGNVRSARLQLGLLVRQDPENEQAWLELARLYKREPSPSTDRTRNCLEQVLRINPQNRTARSGLRELVHAENTNTAPRQPKPTRLPGKTSAVNARGVYLFLACALVLASGSALLSWVVPGNPLALATRTPVPTATLEPTATPIWTPTPSIPDRVAQQIPLLEEAWNQRDWSGAISRLAQISALDASYPGLHAAQCDTYAHWAQELEQQCQFQGAHNLYRQAIAVCGGREDVYQAKAHAMLYLSGKWRHDHQLWPQAAHALQELYDVRPDYASGCQEPLADAEAGREPLSLDVHALLHNSLVAWSRVLLEQNELEQALQAVQDALTLEPNDVQAIELSNKIQLKLKPPPTPTPRQDPSTGKRIEIDISKQRMYVYQGETLLYNWVCSTGKTGSGTATGRFRIQDKIPEAWAGQWSLRMPYWLGIYWVGSIENGIHALPINASGTTLWAGVLGTPASFGCIILSTENAQTLYHWAEIGTPVWIHY